MWRRSSARLCRDAGRRAPSPPQQTILVIIAVINDEGSAVATGGAVNVRVTARRPYR